MTHAVGLRTYQIFVTEEKGKTFIKPDDPSLKLPLSKLIPKFVASRTKSSTVDEQEKTWQIKQKKSDKKGNSVGQIEYGRYGYAASLKDVKTGKQTYRKLRTDSEVLNLYYRFWIPKDESYVLAAFESFSGRSCISLVFDAMRELFDAMRELFDAMNPGYILRIRRLMPSGASAKIYAGKPVKNLTLISRKPPNDLADRLFNGKAKSTKRMSIKIHSARNATLGKFTDLISGLPADSSGVIVYDGVEFDQAVADVRIGNEIKPVGVFGASTEVGVIDVTESVTKDAEGIPTYESVHKEAKKILTAVYETIDGSN